MNKTFIVRQRHFLIKLSVFSLILFGVHYLLLYYFLENTPVFYPLWQIYLFHFITVFLVFGFINLQQARGRKKIFYTFMVLTFSKMALAVVFLLPLLFSAMENKQADVFNFFIPYFLFLAVEVSATGKLVGKM